MKILFAGEQITAKLKFKGANLFNDVPRPVRCRTRTFRMCVLNLLHGAWGADSVNYLTCRFGSSKTF